MVYLVRGLFCLSRSSNQINQIDKMNQRNHLSQLPATRREMSDGKTLTLGLKSPRPGQEKILGPLFVPVLFFSIYLT